MIVGARARIAAGTRRGCTPGGQTRCRGRDPITGSQQAIRDLRPEHVVVSCSPHPKVLAHADRGAGMIARDRNGHGGALEIVRDGRDGWLFAPGDAPHSPLPRRSQPAHVHRLRAEALARFPGRHVEGTLASYASRNLPGLASWSIHTCADRFLVWLSARLLRFTCWVNDGVARRAVVCKGSTRQAARPHAARPICAREKWAEQCARRPVARTMPARSCASA